jgi:predicted nuclease of restriction endonuclease-like (RecB) superfamily
MSKTKQKNPVLAMSIGYRKLIDEIALLHSNGRSAAGRAADIFMTVTYWDTGRRIVEFEQRGKNRAAYGERLLDQLSSDLKQRCGRGYSVDNLELMRLFYLTYPSGPISETLSRKLPDTAGQDKSQETSETLSRKSRGVKPEDVFPLSWSHYVLLCRRVKSKQARMFYETNAIQGGWVVRDLERQIETQYYERSILSRKTPAAKVNKITPKNIDETIKSPYMLEFLGLKDEYSESDLEDALITHMEKFLLELGSEFAFVGRQKRLRLGSEWYRVDLVFFHRTLRCLVLIDLKLGRFTHADAGQMHLYLNYARHHWVLSGENPPVGIILCAFKEDAVVKYALENLPNKVIAAEYQTVLPDKQVLAHEVKTTRRLIEERMALIQDKKK